MNVNITNDQGIRPAVVDAVAPFLEKLKNVLLHFEEPDVYLGDGAVALSMRLSSKDMSLPGDVLEKVLAAVRGMNYGVLVSAQGNRIVLGIYGFIIF